MTRAQMIEAAVRRVRRSYNIEWVLDHEVGHYSCSICGPIISAIRAEFHRMVLTQ